MLTLSVLLGACSLDSNNDSKNYPINEPTLEEISGVWDYSSDHGEYGIDEFYLVVNTSGELFHYDYLGDSYDNLENCYEKLGGDKIIDLGNGEFETSDSLPEIGFAYRAVQKISLPNKNEMQLTIMESEITRQFYADGQTLSLVFSVEFVDENNLTVSIQLGDVSAQFTRKTSLNSEVWSSTYDPSFSEEQIDELYNIVTNEDFNLQTRYVLRSPKAESDLTPLCADASAKSKLNALSRKIEKNRYF